VTEVGQGLEQGLAITELGLDGAEVGHQFRVLGDEGSGTGLAKG
jgi:hypothetical protein